MEVEGIQTGIEVTLTGTNGNAFAIMSLVSKAMKKAKIDKQIIANYQERAISGDYNKLLQVTAEYIKIN